MKIESKLLKKPFLENAVLYDCCIRLNFDVKVHDDGL